MKKPFKVTLPWSASNNHGDLGTYATRVYAENQDQAVMLVAEEMADSSENSLSTPEERKKYIDSMIDVGGDVYEVASDLLVDLEQVFEDEFFPDGCHKTINLEALGKLIAANREFLLQAA